MNYTIDELQELWEEHLVLCGSNYDTVMDIPVTDEFIEMTLGSFGHTEEEIETFIKGL